ncbi:conserved Plasmodium protein, unknown function [Plasmodium ovale curtisi]|uniref:Uncharacterized protein n=1 Tax=Plasmodium ovale curtisi TaxID=864141 RepID=A0A1A8WCX9_PLAOA|nr:conserved Plasmodium protein, unknown function [Plasmodium ovale curtisi]SBS89878.1 conserved Plasmodium protein, unknown function [Plasmodium ovale curtisi]
MNDDQKSDFRLDQSTVSNGLFTVIERKPLSSLENNESLNISNISDPLSNSADCILKKKEENTPANDNICEIYRLTSSQFLNDNLDNTISRISYVDDDVSSFYDSEKEDELYFDNDISTLGSCYSFASPVKIGQASNIGKVKKGRSSISSVTSHNSITGEGHKNCTFEPYIKNNSPPLHKRFFSRKCGINKGRTKGEGDYIEHYNVEKRNKKKELTEGKKGETSYIDEVVSVKNGEDEKAIRLNQNMYRIVNINKSNNDNKEHFIRRVTQIRRSMIKEKKHALDNQGKSFEQEDIDIGTAKIGTAKIGTANIGVSNMRVSNIGIDSMDVVSHQDEKKEKTTNISNESNEIFNKESRNYKNYNRFSEGNVLKKYNNIARYNSDKRVRYKESSPERGGLPYFEEGYKGSYEEAYEEDYEEDHGRRYEDIYEDGCDGHFHRRDNYREGPYYGYTEGSKIERDNTQFKEKGEILKCKNTEKDFVKSTAQENLQREEYHLRDDMYYENYFGKNRRLLTEGNGADDSVNDGTIANANMDSLYSDENELYKVSNGHDERNECGRGENAHIIDGTRFKGKYPQKYEVYRRNKLTYGEYYRGARIKRHNNMDTNKYSNICVDEYTYNDSAGEYPNREDANNVHFFKKKKCFYDRNVMCKQDSNSNNLYSKVYSNNDNIPEEVYEQGKYNYVSGEKINPKEINYTLEGENVPYGDTNIYETEGGSSAYFKNVTNKKKSYQKEGNEENVYHSKDRMDNNNTNCESGPYRTNRYVRGSNQNTGGGGNGSSSGDDMNGRDIFYYDRTNLNGRNNPGRNEYYSDKNAYRDNSYEGKGNHYSSITNRKYEEGGADPCGAATYGGAVASNSIYPHMGHAYAGKSSSRLPNGMHNGMRDVHDTHDEHSRMYNHINGRGSYGNGETHSRNYYPKEFFPVSSGAENDLPGETAHNVPGDAYVQINTRINHNVNNAHFGVEREGQPGKDDMGSECVDNEGGYPTAGKHMHYSEELYGNKVNMNKVLNERRVGVNDEKMMDDGSIPQGGQILPPNGEKREEARYSNSLNGIKCNENEVVGQLGEKDKVHILPNEGEMAKENTDVQRRVNDSLAQQGGAGMSVAESQNKQNNDPQPPVKRKRGRPKLKKTTPPEEIQSENQNNAVAAASASASASASVAPAASASPAYPILNPNLQTNNMSNISSNVMNEPNQQIYNNMTSAINPVYGNQLPHNMSTHMSMPLEQPHGPPMNQAMNQPMNQAVNQPMSQAMGQPMNQPMSQAMGQPMNQPHAQLMSYQVGGPPQQLGHQLGDPLNQQINQPLVQQLGGPLDQHIAQQMNHTINQQIGMPINQQQGQHMNINTNQTYNHPMFHMGGNVGQSMYVAPGRMNNFSGNLNDDNFPAIYGPFDKDVVSNVDPNFYYRSVEQMKTNKDNVSYEDEEELVRNGKRHARSTVSESEERYSDREIKKVHKKRGRKRKNEVEQMIDYKKDGINIRGNSQNSENKTVDTQKSDANNEHTRKEVDDDSGYSTFVDENNKTVSYSKGDKAKDEKGIVPSCGCRVGEDIGRQVWPYDFNCAKSNDECDFVKKEINRIREHFTQPHSKHQKEKMHFSKG